MSARRRRARLDDGETTDPASLSFDEPSEDTLDLTESTFEQEHTSASLQPSSARARVDQQQIERLLKAADQAERLVNEATELFEQVQKNKNQWEEALDDHRKRGESLQLKIGKLKEDIPPKSHKQNWCKHLAWAAAGWLVGVCGCLFIDFSIRAIG